MTQIQAYENMSKEALIEHHRHTLQQHADDMDMLSKELASRSTDTQHDSKTLADWLAEAPSSWDEEYRSIWAKLQVAETKAAQYRKQWRSAVAARIANDQFTDCTCPSGYGSLRWPCPVHPPEV